jgi:CheY-like chemotaxis protein
MQRNHAAGHDLQTLRQRKKASATIDIADGKRSADGLKASLKEIINLRAALDRHAIVAITDPQGKITFANDKFCAISKCSREELLGQDHRIINSGYHPKEFIRDLWTTIAQGRVWHGEMKTLPPANGELLLIVDDEESILQVAKAILENHGYRVLTAADATEALAIFALRMNEIDLVLTDLAMPFMDGVALIRTLQKMKPDVRLVASTGRGGQDERADEIAHLKVRASLTKPYNKNKLLATLHDVLTQPSAALSSSNGQLETSTL